MRRYNMFVPHNRLNRKVAFLTSKDLPSCTSDDLLAASPLKSQGFDLVPVIWDEVSILELNRFAAVIIRSPWDYQHKKDQFTAFLKALESLHIPVLNPPSLMLWNMDKNYLFELEKKGTAIVPSQRVPANQSAETWKEKIDQAPWERLVLKPTVSASAYNTFLVNKAEAILRLHQWEALSHKVDFLIQEFCESIQTEGEASLIFFNDKKNIQYSHAVMKNPKNSDFRVQPHLGGTAQAWRADSTAVHFSTDLLSGISENWLYARVDILRNNNSWVLGELEMLEPQLFLQFDSDSAQRFAKAIASHIASE